MTQKKTYEAPRIVKSKTALQSIAALQAQSNNQ
jgi:hypothetical protein